MVFTKLSSVLFSLVVYLASTQGCLKAFLRNYELADPPFNDDDNNGLPASPAVQAIIPTYKFYCNCVNITSWETYVSRSIKSKYHITFQVWRPSPTVTNETGYSGFYSLVGQNRFTNIRFTQGSLVWLTPTPPSNSIITAQSGDVVGYYTNSRNKRGIQLERDDYYERNIVWYQTIRNTDTSMTLNTTSFILVGSGGTLTL